MELAKESNYVFCRQQVCKHGAIQVGWNPDDAATCPGSTGFGMYCVFIYGGALIQ